MKRSIFSTLGLLLSLLFWSATSINAHGASSTKSKCEGMDIDLTNPEAPRFDIRICANVGPVSFCVTLSCDAHWTDLIQPGLGQLFGHEGCKVVGIASNPSTGVAANFQGSSEDMILALEQAMGVKKGSLKDILITTSPTFPAPDGEEYRVVAKKYPVLKGADGRYVALEVEVVK